MTLDLLGKGVKEEARPECQELMGSGLALSSGPTAFNPDGTKLGEPDFTGTLTCDTKSQPSPRFQAVFFPYAVL